MKKKTGRIHKEWSFQSDSLLLSAPVAADIDGDGRKEVLFSTKNGRVYSLNSEGKLKWIFDINEKVDEVELMFLDTDSANSINTTPNIADIDNDGEKEILVGSEMGVLYCLSKNGKEKWKYKTHGAIRGGIVSFDINNDGHLEAIFGSADKKLYILSSKGDLLTSFSVESEIESTPLLLPEYKMIVFGTAEGVIYAVDFSGKQLWQYKTKDKILAEPIFVKSQKTCREMIVIGSCDHYLYSLSINGQLFWKFKTDGAIFSKAEAADINQDGRPEIIFGSCDNNLYALNCEGEKLWAYETDFWVVASPLIMDIDNDGKMEIIVGSYDHNLYVLDAAGEYVLDYVPGLSSLVHQTGSYSDVQTQEPGHHATRKLWQFNTEGIIVGCTELEKGKVVVNTKKGSVEIIKHSETA
ncbi:MAG: PQQ-binding-like beta-propeller repeat protein [Candidatus Woesearchaeota archaeon]